MTFVGKIFVILIMALSLVFLGVTTVVFVTSTNWKVEYEKQKAAVNTINNKLKTANVNEASLTKQVEDLKREAAASLATANAKITALSADLTKATDTITDAQKALTDAQANAAMATQEAQARLTDMTKVRTELTTVIDVNSKLKANETELNTQILTLQRALAASERTATQMRELSLKFAKVLRTNGLSTDVTGVSPDEIPPDVEGKVTKVDARNRTIEISIGSDDGLTVGQELFLFRTTPEGRYLGKVKISATDPDQAVAVVIGKTVNGLQIKEGDDVASTLRSK